ncbi:MAG: hypothetical protein KF839_03695 [Nitrosomonas sp.]|nr:hypothetical protein [Nitrosomonas sp.]
MDSEKLGSKELWFSVPEKYAHGLCKSRMDGFLVGMVFPAMQYGENIHVEGCISSQLLFNLNQYVIPMLMAFLPACKWINITAAESNAEHFDCSGVGTGFSGGVDSFCTFFDHYELEKNTENRINSLVFLNVGSNGPGRTDEELMAAHKKFCSRYEYLSKFPEEFSLDFISLDSNLHSFHPWGHQLTHSLTTISAVLVMQNMYRKYFYASGGLSYLELYKYHELLLKRDTALIDPMLLPLLSTESLNFISDGAQYTRVEKTLRIVDYEPVKRYLNVCVHDRESHENCSVCGKCCRTLMTLNSIGKLEEFSKLFDIGKYKKHAEFLYLCQQVVLQNKDPFARNSIELAKRNGIKLPSFLVSYGLVSLLGLARTYLPKAILSRIRMFLNRS